MTNEIKKSKPRLLTKLRVFFSGMLEKCFLLYFIHFGDFVIKSFLFVHSKLFGRVKIDVRVKYSSINGYIPLSCLGGETIRKKIERHDKIVKPLIKDWENNIHLSPPEFVKRISQIEACL